MAYWIYKCNFRNRDYQSAYGDWDEVFAGTASVKWGSTGWIGELSKARAGDTILAYQTDRNELVGLAKVVRFDAVGAFRHIVLRPIEEIRARVLPLKKASKRIAGIPALKQGPVHTLYSISAGDARALLRAAKSVHDASLEEAEIEAESALQGGGFGTPEENRKVERAAMSYVRRHYTERNWRVRDVSRAGVHYDLECRRGREVLHVEVKGVRGSVQQFILTSAEEAQWRGDKKFCLALVTSALSQPQLFRFRGPKSLNSIEKKVISFVCVKKASKSIAEK